jgi:probable HAF family extracellular repeat protein
LEVVLLVSFVFARIVRDLSHCGATVFHGSGARLNLRRSDAALFASVSLVALCLGAPAAAQSVTASAPTFLGTLGGSSSYPYAMSSDGSVVVGGAYLTGDTTTHAFRWTGARGMADLGTLGGAYSYADLVSSDGSVVVGQSYTTANTGYHAFRWTGAGGMADLGTLGGTFSFAAAMNSSGSVIVGESTLSNNTTHFTTHHAFRWTGAGGMADLGTLGGTHSTAYAVNSDGSVVVGDAYLTGDTTIHAFRWTGAGGMADLGTLGGPYSTAYAVNSDGSVVVGEANLPGNAGYHAFRWTGAGGMADLGTLGGTLSTANAVNSDGSVVVGDAYLTGNTATHAFRWTSAGGMADLGALGGTYSSAAAMNSSGSVIVGESTLSDNATHHAFRWTSATGIADLNTLLSNAGVSMTGVTLYSANGISANGQIIAGSGARTAGGNTQAYIVRYVDATVPAPVGGVTTLASVQASANQLSRERQVVMGQDHGFLDQLLQEGTRMVAPDSAGAYGALGSATGGGSGRTHYGPIELIMGLGAASENYAGVSMNDAVIAAAKLRYVHALNAQYGLFGEIGGYYSPSGTYNFSRTYANGAAFAKATEQVSGDQTYGFGRIGALINVTLADEVAPSLEIGGQALHTNSYSELFSAINPFEAHLPAANSTLDVFKARAQWTHNFTPAIDATIWAAWAHGFNYYDGSQLFVDGIGNFAPQYASTLNWAEYGIRVGYKVNEMITTSIFVNGVAGDITGSKAHVGGGVSVKF